MASASSEARETVLRVPGDYQQEYDPGETIFDAGDRGERLYVVRRGEVELTREGPQGHRGVARLGPGDFFGELSLVHGARTTTRAVAVKPTCVLELDRETLEAMCLEQPAIAIRLVRVLVSRLVEAERRLAVLGADDLLRPVVRQLVRLAEPQPDAPGARQVETSLRSLAEDTGLSLLETHRALHQLFDCKLLRLGDDRLLIPDMDALAACID